MPSESSSEAGPQTSQIQTFDAPDVTAIKHTNDGFRRLIALARPHARHLALATISLAIGSGITLVYPQAARLVVDDVFGDKARYDMTTVGLGLVALFVIQSVFVTLRYYLFTVTGDRIVADLRKRLFDAIITREMGFFDSNRTGELTSRLASDTQVLQSAVTTNLSMALRYIVQALGGIVLLFYTSWRLSLIILLVLPALLAIAIIYGRKVRSMSREVQDRIADSTSVAEEAFSAIRTVRSFAREGRESTRYASSVEQSFDMARRRAKLGAIFGGGVSFLGYSAIALVLWLGSTFVLSGAMSAGDLTAYLLYVMFVAVALGILSGLWTDFARAVGSSERVFSLLDGNASAEPIAQPEHATSGRISTHGHPRPGPANGHVVFERVDFEYPSRPGQVVLQDVSFELFPGQRLAVVGSSGSGKSTIAALLSRFYEATAGTIRIDGTDVGHFDVNSLRESVAMVAQEPTLFSGTIRENVLYGCPEADNERIVACLKDAHAWEFVQGFADGMDTIVGERGVRLSGGQKQRIAIARALIKNPLILILDEATSALDVQSEHLVQQALERLMQGRTTLVIAHRLSTIAGADCVLVLEQGRVVEQGTHHALMAINGTYARLVEMQTFSEAR